MQHLLVICLFFFCWHVLVHSNAIVTASAQGRARSYETDREALLAIKEGIEHDPLKTVEYWDHFTDFCEWQGVKCDGVNQRVISLDLSSRHLVGTLSPYIGRLTSLKVLVLRDNKFRGHIPPQIGDLGSCEKIDLGGNHFKGSIPPSFQQLKGLKVLNISHNNLSGVIPEFLGDLPSILDLDLSHNDFVGQVPNKGVFVHGDAFAFQFSGNKRLCRGALRLRLPPCPFPREHPAIVAIVLPIIALVGCVVLLVAVYWRWKRARSNVLLTQSVGVVPPKLNKLSGPSYHELLQATGHFSMENLLGKGSFGSVYKGIFSTGEVLAVKVFNLSVRGASKSFLAECQALKNIRHRNLVKIISACSSIDFKGQDFKALVFKFMIKGNLDSLLHQEFSSGAEEGSRCLNLTQRLNIAIDVANALEYLHHDCHEQVIHCDLKPSNILLDSDLVAHVGDFGLARLVKQLESQTSHQSQTSSLGVKGTIGYIPPEYSMAIKASEKGDVYSYGIILLELFTGKRPTNAMFGGNLTLRSFVETGLSSDQVMQIVDAQLVPTNEESGASSSNSTFQQLGTSRYRTINDGLVSILRTGLMCSAESPKYRIDIRCALKELLKVKKLLASVMRETQR